MSTWKIEMGGMYNIKGSKYFGRKIFVEPNQIKDIRKKFNNTDVYATILSYNKEVQNESDLYGPLYLDLDLDINSESDYLILKQELSRIVTYMDLNYDIPISCIKFYFTGKKGFHLLVPPEVLDIDPDPNLNIYYKEIAKELNKATFTNLIDTKIYDNKRLLRLPNSINAKTGLYKVPITYDNIIRFNWKEIQEYASSPKPIIKIEAKPREKAVRKFNEVKESINNPKKQNRQVKPIKTVDINEVELPSCITNILTNGATEGNRNNTTVILASSLLQHGVSYRETLEAVTIWNEQLLEPSLPQTEIDITVASAYQQVQAGRRYGCSAIKNCDLCVGRDCKIFK